MSRRHFVVSVLVLSAVALVLLGSLLSFESAPTGFAVAGVEAVSVHGIVSAAIVAVGALILLAGVGYVFNVVRS